MNVRAALPLLLVAVVPAVSAVALGRTPLAKVKVQNASDQHMKAVVFRGTLPLPADFAGDIRELALRDGSKVLDTQVGILATYPGSDESHPVGRPEVVQLVARADLPASAFKEFDVVRRPAPSGAAKAAAAGKALSAVLDGAAPVVVEASDCFGNRYRAAALDESCLVETRLSGPLLVERVFQSALTPVAAAAPGKPALKHFLRVRAYLTTYAGEDFATLALMIFNGSIDSPNGPVYYRDIRVGVVEPLELEVWLKKFSPAADGQTSVSDGYTWQPCPPPAEGGKVYVMSHGSAGILRTTIFAPGAKARATQFTRQPPVFVPVPSLELWSWSNLATARYGGPKYPMPLSVGANALAQANQTVGAALSSRDLSMAVRYLRNPDPSVTYRTLGHAMPAGVAYGGMTGGTGINNVFGARAAVTGHNGLIQYHVLLADRNWDRQREHLFHDDGKPCTYGRLLADRGGHKQLTIGYGHAGNWKLDIKDPACEAQADHVKANDLLSPQAKKFLEYMDHDDQHLSRLGDSVPAAYLACDPVNRDRLVTLGSQSCWKLSIYPLADNPNSGGWLSLYDLRKETDAKPHTGLGVGRSHGWVTFALSGAFYLSQDEQIRADCLAVARADAQCRAKAQMPAGNVQASYPSGKALVKAGLVKPDDKETLERFQKTHFLVRPWEDGGILADGARCVVEMLSSPADREDAELLKAVYARVGKWNATVGWQDRTNSPGFIVAVPKVAGAGETIPYGQPTGFYLGSVFAWFYELTGDQLFVDRLKTMAGKRGLEGRGLRELGNWSYPLWLVQGGRLPGRDPIRP